MKIAIVGDVHMHFKGLAYIVRTHSPDVILQCGDFGYWPKDNNYNIDYCKNGQTKIYFCDGNHEDHESLRSLTNNEIHPNIFYQPRGSILKLGDYNILFMGGAHSVDKAQRTPGYDWFPEENISERDLYNIPDDRIDVFISHTSPVEFDFEKYSITEKKNDGNRKYLSCILDTYKPKLWYFGHWHTNDWGKYNDCIWYAMNQIDGQGKGYLRWL